jgi:hypothetical protein
MLDLQAILQRRHKLPAVLGRTAPQLRQMRFQRVSLSGCLTVDFFTTEVWTLDGLVTFYVLFFMSWAVGGCILPG